MPPLALERVHWPQSKPTMRPLSGERQRGDPKHENCKCWREPTPEFDQKRHGGWGCTETNPLP